jgi:pyruvate/2-oxoglutarate dehydrogenase complex dihydrolipoamide dehydrogenase (E3) component
MSQEVNQPTAGTRSETTYHLVVLGGGTAGWVAARAAASLGARVLLIERSTLGGDGYVGRAVPYQYLRTAVLSKRAGSFAPTDWDALGADARAASTQAAQRHPATELTSLGIDLIRAEARFADTRTLIVDSRTIPLARAVIATGSQPRPPRIAGLTPEHYIDPEQLLTLPALPARVGIIGGGTRGVEIAQICARLGSAVNLYERGDRLLRSFPADAEPIIREQLIADGVTVRVGCRNERAVSTDRVVELSGESTAGDYHDQVDLVIAACGRDSAIESLNLSAAGVECIDGLIDIDDRLRTTNRRIFAAGDVCSVERSVHRARAHGRQIVANALFFGRDRVSTLPSPLCLCTDPAVATVGLAAESAPRLRVITLQLAEVDADLNHEHPRGYLSIVHDRSGVIRGATIVSRHAGHVIGELAIAVHQRLKLSALTTVLHPYASPGETLRLAADHYRRSLLTPFTTSILRQVAQLKR